MAPRSFPTFLTPAFDPRALELVDSTIVVIDPEGRLLWANPAWGRVAEEHGCDPEFSSYFDGITPPLRDFYRAVFADAIATGKVYEQEYECSTSMTYRRMHLRALPIDSTGLLLEHSVVVEHPHDREAEEACQYIGPEGTIHQCSNCRRVRCHEREHAWHWVPVWVERPPPITSHVICPLCVGYYWGRRRTSKQRQPR